MFYFVGDLKPEWKISNIEIFIGKGRNAKVNNLKIVNSVATDNRSRFIMIFLPNDFPNLLLPDREYTLKIVSKDSIGNDLPSFSFTYGLLIRSKIRKYIMGEITAVKLFKQHYDLCLSVSQRSSDYYVTESLCSLNHKRFYRRSMTCS